MNGARLRQTGRGRGRLRLLPSPARAGGLLGLVVALLAGYGLATSAAFAIRQVDVSPLQYTDRAYLVRLLALGEGSNAFGLSTAGLAARVEQLPAVLSAGVAVALPDRLVVTVAERTPILVWKVGSASFLVDRAGVLFAVVSQAPTVAASLPAVVDGRAESRVVLGIGSQVDPVDLDAATRLASLKPSDVGSAASALVVRITDADGFVVTTSPASWSAVFGTYGPVLRTPDLIPGQVRLLRSLLYGRERQIARIVLADDQNGTYVPLPSGR